MIRPSKVLYTTSAIATGGRDGKVFTTDSILNVALSTPKELGGPGGEATNPEQLFAAGYSACFLSALKLVAAKNKVNVPADANVKGTVGIGPAGAGFAIQVDLEVSLSGIETDQAQSLVEMAHQVCPYSIATRDNIQVNISIAED
ncbi:organic hydroperoxide resistance protein [Spirochaeta cellobiosiphila]|uniref:organic hydroperoxide resistance protein n=1 Tax=Spirochaeta cellobiosiphila TaxID=504483 RepID=UPI00040FE871|nr:organic hydroperoxide resistance protein [Spirochaeta cellobiosiphila]